MVRARFEPGVVVVTIDGPGRPDLATVEELAGLALIARRHGLAMRIAVVTPALFELLELCGLHGVVLGAGRVQEPR